MYGSKHKWLVNSSNNFFIANYCKDKHRQTGIAGWPTVHSDTKMVKWMRMCHQGPCLLLWAVCSFFSCHGRWLQRWLKDSRSMSHRPIPAYNELSISGWIWSPHSGLPFHTKSKRSYYWSDEVHLGYGCLLDPWLWVILRTIWDRKIAALLSKFLMHC